MDNQDNPYINLLGLMRVEGSVNNPVPFLIGKVVSANPFLVQVDNIQLERKDLLINSELLSGTSKEVSISAESVTGSLNTEHGGTLDSFNMTNGSIININNNFSVSDKVVLLMSKNQQQFILICKVR